MKSIIFFALVGLSFAEKFRYDNYKVVNLKIQNVLQLKKMQEFEENSKDLTFLDPPTSSRMHLEAVIAPTFFPIFQDAAQRLGMSYNVTQENYQKLLDLEMPPRKGKVDRFDFTSYYNLEAIYEWLNVLGSTYPDKVTLFDLGTSYEGRTIRGIKISSQKAVRNFF